MLQIIAVLQAKWPGGAKRARDLNSIGSKGSSYSILTNASCSITAPGAAETSDVPAEKQGAVDLTQAIATIASARKAYSESKLPPTPPIPFKRWRPERVEDAPHDPHAYFPMLLVK